MVESPPGSSHGSLCSLHRRASARPQLPCSQPVPRARPVQCCAARGVPQRALSQCGGCADTGSGTPRARTSAAAASAGCARGNCLSSPQPSREPQRYAPSSPPAAARLPCAAGGASFWSPPSPPLGRYIVRYTVSAAVGGPVNAACGRAAPASCWAASSFYSPVGQRNGPSLRFGLLAFAQSAPKGLKVCSRLRPLHGLFKCFRPQRGA